MKTDRELLELAAKAAGIKWDVSRNSVSGWLLATQIEQFDDFCEPYFVEDKIWWPLHDDGDALRLAVTLGLTVECDFNDSDTCTVTQARGGILVDESAGMVGEVIGEPDFAATRRAIVRAAAAIGEGMK